MALLNGAKVGREIEEVGLGHACADCVEHDGFSIDVSGVLDLLDGDVEGAATHEGEGDGGG